MNNKINYNKMMGGVFDNCNMDIDRKSPTYIYYVPMTNCQDDISKDDNDTGYIFEKKIYESQNFYSEFRKMLEICDTSNVMIFFSSYKDGKQCDDSEEYVDKINDAIEKIVNEFPSISMSNVVIIHLTDNIDKVLFKINVNNNRYFKKVINILPHQLIDGKVVQTTKQIPGKNYSAKALQEIYNQVRNIKKAGASATLSYDLYSNLHEGDPKDNKFPPMPLGSKIRREIVIKTMNISDIIGKTSKFNHTWWFKYYMESPYCLYNRLFQSSGTCWMNTTINLFILLSPLSSILIQKFKKLLESRRKEIEKYTYEDIKKETLDFTTCIYIVVNQLLIHKNKPIYTDGDIIVNMAKKLQQEGVEDKYKSQFNGQGGNASQAILFIIDKLDLYDSVNGIDLDIQNNFEKKSAGNNLPTLIDYCKNMKEKIKLYKYVKEKDKIFSFSNLFIDSTKNEDIYKIKDEDNYFTEQIEIIFKKIKELKEKRKKSTFSDVSKKYDEEDDRENYKKFTANEMSIKNNSDFMTVQDHMVNYYNGLDGNTQKKINNDYDEYMESTNSIVEEQNKINDILNNLKLFIHNDSYLDLQIKKNKRVEQSIIVNELKNKKKSDPTDDEISLFMTKMNEVARIKVNQKQIESGMVLNQIKQIDQENGTIQDKNSEKYRTNTGIRNMLINKYNDDLDPDKLKDNEKKFLVEMEKAIEDEIASRIQTKLSKEEISEISNLMKKIEVEKKKTSTLTDDEMGYYLSETMKKIGGNKKILFVVGTLQSPNIKINGYVLIGSALSTDSHAVMGLKCITDNKFYIYDSNNIIAQTQWNLGDYSEYYRKRDAGFGDGKYSEKVGEIHTVQCLIYVKE